MQSIKQLSTLRDMKESTEAFATSFEVFKLQPGAILPTFKYDVDSSWEFLGARVKDCKRAMLFGCVDDHDNYANHTVVVEYIHGQVLVMDLNVRQCELEWNEIEESSYDEVRTLILTHLNTSLVKEES